MSKQKAFELLQNGKITQEQYDKIMDVLEGNYYLILICANCGKNYGKRACDKNQHGKFSHGYCDECSDLQLKSIDFYNENDMQKYNELNDLFLARNFVNFSTELLKTCSDFLLPFVVTNIKKYNMQRGL